MPLDEIKTVTIDENDWRYDLYQTESTPDPEPEVIPEPEAIVEPEPEPTPEPEKEVVEPVVETVVPEYKAKKYVPIEDEEKLAELLDRKYGYKKLNPEEKALAFIKEQNPELDDNEILFIAANDYGIGVEKPSEEDLTSEQALELKKQDIARKKLYSQAESFFAEQASKVELAGEDPLELDPAYKTYKEQIAEQERVRVQQAEKYKETIQEVKSAAKSISDYKIPEEIDLDGSKFAFEINFKMDDKKQAELVAYTERYTPTEDEIAQYTDTTTGKFDWKGYMGYMAEKAFEKDIRKAAIRQALAQDRQQFIEKELKNSTLRNNDVSKVSDTKIDHVDWYWDRVAGR